MRYVSEKRSPLIQILATTLRKRAALTISLLISLSVVGCQTDQARVVAERNAVVQQQIDHDKALAQARADLERQSATGSAVAPPSEAKPSPMDPLRPDKPSEEEAGFPIYPNAQIYREAGNNLNSVHSSSGITVVVLETMDTPSAVIAFYEPKLTHTSSRGAKKTVKPERQERMENGARIVKFTETQENNTVRIVKIYQEKDKTLIELMNIKSSGPPSSLPNPPSTPATAGSTAPAETIPASPLPSPPDDPLKPPPLLPGPTSR